MNYDNELIEAKKTLLLSSQTADRFVQQLGALNPILIPPLPGATLGKRPGYHASVLDQIYWFAKLYELVTRQEIEFSVHTQYPGFSLHFIKVFYGMYFNALEKYLRGQIGSVNPLWVTHFRGPQAASGERPEPDSTEAVEYSVRTGATAHIQGDMPVALVTAYQSWLANPKPAFGDLKEDFIVRSEGAFRAAQGRFYVEVNDKIASPVRAEVGQLGAAYYQAVFHIQPSLDVMFQWRRQAWQKAATSV